MIPGGALPATPWSPMHLRLRLLVAAACLTAAAGCGRKYEPPLEGGPRPGDPPSVTVAPRLTVIDIRLHRKNAMENPVPEIVDRFTPKEGVVVSVVTQGTTVTATVAARVLHEGRTVSEQVTQFAPTGTTATTFEVTPSAGWAEGRYKVVVLLEGKPAGERDFVVAASEG